MAARPTDRRHLLQRDDFPMVSAISGQGPAGRYRANLLAIAASPQFLRIGGRVLLQRGERVAERAGACDVMSGPWYDLRVSVEHAPAAERGRALRILFNVHAVVLARQIHHAAG